jgi:hypothetical protein
MGTQGRFRLRWYFEDYLDTRLTRPRRSPPRLKGCSPASGGLVPGGVPLWRGRSRPVGEGPRPAAIPAGRGGKRRRRGRGTAWELLRDPATDAPLACAAAAFVRTHPRAARGPVLPSPPAAGGPVAGAAGDLPPARAGQPYQVVHFDSHRTWADLAPENDGAEGMNLPASQLGVLSPIRPGAHGYLLLEAPASRATGCWSTGRRWAGCSPRRGGRADAQRLPVRLRRHAPHHRTARPEQASRMPRTCPPKHVNSRVSRVRTLFR